jgi:hypothetical protein
VALTVNIGFLKDDLRSFGKAAKSFIHNKQRLSDLETQLTNAVAEAKRGNGGVIWSTSVGSGGPIRTELSHSYRSSNACNKAPAKALFAEVSFNFCGELDAVDNNILVIRSGGTRVRLCWSGTDGETVCHFDIHPNASGHPMLHVQFDSAISELPRLHSFLSHPLDVLEFTLMEVFQDRWRRLLSEPKYASEIRRYPANQRRRIQSLFSKYYAWINSSEPVLISLLRTPQVPFELYPKAEQSETV